jgi:hypothetical protein
MPKKTPHNLNIIFICQLIDKYLADYDVFVWEKQQKNGDLINVYSGVEGFLLDIPANKGVVNKYTRNEPFIGSFDQLVNYAECPVHHGAALSKRSWSNVYLRNLFSPRRRRILGKIAIFSKKSDYLYTSESPENTELFGMIRQLELAFQILDSHRNSEARIKRLERALDKHIERINPDDDVHDIKNNMLFIKNPIKIAIDNRELEIPEAVRADMSDWLDAVMRTEELAKGYLKSLTRHNSYEDLEVRAMLDRFHENKAAPLAAQKIKFSLRRLPDFAWIRAKERPLLRAIENILANAIDSVLEKRKGRKNIELGAFVEGDIVRILIQDNGVGIPREIVEEVHLPGVTTKVNGTGIGLAYAKRIAIEHSGDLRVRSTWGRGATVEVFLPIL